MNLGEHEFTIIVCYRNVIRKQVDINIFYSFQNVVNMN